MPRPLGRPVPTRRGWTLAGASVALVIGSRILGAGALAGLGLSGLLLLGFALAYVTRGRPALDIRRHARPSRVHVGAEGRVVLEGVTTARTALLALTEMVDGGARSARFVLSPSNAGERIDATYRVPTTRRGRHELGPLLAIITDPLGLARRAWEVVDVTDIIVRPRVHPVHAPRRAGGGDQDPRAEGTRVPAFEPAGEFLALRDYEPGDDPRRVHWRSSARLGELVVRQDEAAAPGRVVLLLDTRAAAHDDASFEIAVEAIASLATRLRQDHAPVEVVTTEGRVLSRPGPGTLELLLDRLAVVEVTDSDLLSAVGARLATRLGLGAFVAVTGTPDRVLLDTLAPLSSRAIVTVVATRTGTSLHRVPGLTVVDATTEPFATAWNRIHARRGSRRRAG
ncbi:MAG: DUF58 domain-containing protein [Acidimicrobiia bacterium]|nr:DUF58 domain-containing protein [Acidimicrobiia bacterium]